MTTTQTCVPASHAHVTSILVLIAQYVLNILIHLKLFISVIMLNILLILLQKTTIMQTSYLIPQHNTLVIKTHVIE